MTVRFYVEGAAAGDVVEVVLRFRASVDPRRYYGLAAGRAERSGPDGLGPWRTVRHVVESRATVRRPDPVASKRHF